MKILVTDGREAADFLIGSLLAKRHTVVVVNADRRYSKYLASTHDMTVINGDASKRYILDEAKVRDFDLVAALGDNDATNLVICQTAKLSYGIRKAVAIVGNPRSVDVFRQLGVDSAISSAHLVATSIELASDLDELSRTLSLAHGSVTVSELRIDKNCPARGKRVVDLAIEDDFNISCLVRDSGAIIPRGTTSIEEGDILIVVTEAGKTDRVLDLLAGKGRKK
jgi:trk system potassium uptake protein